MPFATAQDYRRVRAALRFVTDYPAAASHFFVNSVTGSTGTGYGYTPDAPLTTIDAAVDLCTASKGDTIHVLPYHAETITASALCALDKAGIRVIGYGEGAATPIITLGTDTTATITISADDVTIRNIVFKSNVDDLAIMIDVNEDGVTFEDCVFWAPAAKDCLDFVDLATTKDNFVFRRCRWLSEADPAGTDGAANTGGIYLVDTERVLLEDCVFDGFFETACIHNKTTACKYLTTRRCSLNQQLAATGQRWRFPTGTVGVQIDHANDPGFYPGLGYRATKTEDVNVATSDDLFNVTGKVLIRLWNGDVTNALGAAVTDYQITLTTLAGVLVAAGNLASAIIGHQFTLNCDSGDTSLSTSSSAVSVGGVGDTNGKFGHLVVGRTGLITDVIKAVRTAGDASDAIVHTVFWMPLEVGAHLHDAA